MKEITVQTASKLYRKTQTTIKIWLDRWSKNDLGVPGVFRYNEAGKQIINPDQLDKWLVKYRNGDDFKWKKL